ncbi:MAG TPA: cytochrome c biogenesis protein ResB [Phycisphaerae bacterium]|nr:cytochrome c biogenesis protein ResB [Phycisphaerae bacterium]
MARGRQVGLGLTLGALGVLASVSIVGAFLGAERARAMFNSQPLVAFWILLAGLLVAGFFLMPRLVRSPGLAAMHLGALLVLVGGMGGSDLGHRLAGRLFGAAKIPHGYMAVEEGDATDAVRDGETGEAIGRLPFRIRLEDFRIEYYPSDRPWELWLERPVVFGEGFEMGMAPVAWREGEEASAGESQIRVRVVRYLSAAAPVYDGAGGLVGAEADAGSDAAAMEVIVSLGERSVHGWLAPAKGESRTAFSLAPLLPDEVRGHPALALWFVRPPSMPKDYFSDLAVLEGERTMARKTIEVNHPLHWGGYHFYQAGYDEAAGQYTILLVRSASGLTAAYVGFALLVAGAMARCWVEPAVRKLKGRA